jgi:hypothetical protein
LAAIASSAKRGKSRWAKEFSHNTACLVAFFCGDSERSTKKTSQIATWPTAVAAACNLNTHFHLVALEGVYVEPQTEEAIARFVAFEPPTDQEVCDVVEKIATKTIQFLRKKGYLQEEGEEVLRPDLDQLFQDHPGMTEAMAASIQSKIAFGERAGQKVRRVGSGLGPIATRRDGRPDSAMRGKRHLLRALSAPRLMASISMQRLVLPHLPATGCCS